MNGERKHFYAFGPFRLDPEERLLLRDGRPVPLAPKVTETLLLLIQNAGHLVDKDELMKRVWPDAFVEEGNLNKNIFLLRKVLGQWNGGLEYIETVPKRGYRFVASVNQEVEEETSSTSSPRQAAAVAKETALTVPIGWPRGKKAIGILLVLALAGIAAWQIGSRRRPERVTSDTAAIHSLAVLPLENLSGDPAQDYFADSMTDELITDLGQIGELRVISRTSAMQYKGGARKPMPQIARELNVDAVVEGTVLRSDNQIRITAQLIQAPADKHLWAQSYEGNARDVLTLQRQVASAIAEQIRIKLTPQQRTVLKTARFVNPEAYEDYMRGHYVTQTGAIDGYERSIVYFNQAIKKDAQNALAYAGLADSYIELGHMVRMPPEQAFPTARKAALQALQLDDSLAEAHEALANVKFLYDWDFPGADREFRRALDLNPNSVSARADYADYLIAMGRFDESIAERRRNLQMDPLAQRPIWALATGYYWAHRYDEAIAEARQAMEMDPNHWSGHLDLGLALEQKHQFPAAISELQKAIEVSNDKIWVSFIAHDMALSGDKAGAEKILADLQQLSKRTYVSPWLLAMIYPDLGDKEKAFTWLEKCYERREHDLVFSKVWPMFDGLRSDPRYTDLMRRIGLPQ
jgi:TolB-like protein/DNA-binding winged helix-turn-helix (wHTH) protein/thioredoxin-like negative regulator of GroEL